MQISTHIHQCGSFRVCKDPEESLCQGIILQKVFVKLCSRLAPTGKGVMTTLLLVHSTLTAMRQLSFKQPLLSVQHSQGGQ